MKQCEYKGTAQSCVALRTCRKSALIDAGTVEVSRAVVLSEDNILADEIVCDELWFVCQAVNLISLPIIEYSYSIDF